MKKPAVPSSPSPRSGGSLRHEIDFMHRIKHLDTIILGDIGNQGNLGKTLEKTDAKLDSSVSKAIVTQSVPQASVRRPGLSSAIVVMLDRTRQVRDMLRMFEVSNTTVMVMDRSDFSLKNMVSTIKFLDDESHFLKERSIVPQEIRGWLHAPHQGHFLVSIVDRSKKMVTYRFGDDLIELLDTVKPVMDELSFEFLKDATVSWAPLLNEAMNIIFLRWLCESRRIEKMVNKIQS